MRGQSREWGVKGDRRRARAREDEVPRALQIENYLGTTASIYHRVSAPSPLAVPFAARPATPSPVSFTITLPRLQRPWPAGAGMSTSPMTVRPVLAVAWPCRLVAAANLLDWIGGRWRLPCRPPSRPNRRAARCASEERLESFT